MKAIENKVGMISVFCVACAMSLPSFADVAYSLEGGTLTVNAPSSLAGHGLFLLWDVVDKGTTVSDWANSANIVETVPAIGGTYTVELDTYGITNGTPCRIAASTMYQRLDKLHMNAAGAYADTGVPANKVYGIKLGYYNTGCAKSGKNNYFMGGTGSSNLYIGIKDADSTQCAYKWGGTSYTCSSSLSATGINDLEFKDGKVLVNGVDQSLTISGAAGGSSSGSIHVGHLNQSSSSYNTYYAYGWWSYVTLYGSDGGVLIDYIPVKRATDEKVGFYDNVTKGFVLPAGAVDFVAGTTNGETVIGFEMASKTFSPNRLVQASMQKGVLTVTVPAALGGEQLLILWDNVDRGGEISAWAHSAVLVDQVAAAGGTYTTRIARLGIRNGDVCRIAAANCFYLLDKVQSTSGEAYVRSEIWSHDVYGVRLGYYNTGNNGTDNPYFMGYRSNFFLGIVESNGTSNGTTLRYKWNGTNGDETFTISDSEINDIAFTNGIININGTVQAPTVSGAAGGSENGYIRIGRTINNDYDTRYAYGWWSYVVFYGADGGILLDYIPAKRVADNEVGFYDRVKKSFVPSSGTEAFIAGTVTSETPTVAVNSCSTAFTVATIPGIMVIVK